MPFDYQPVLKSDLIELRPLHPDEFDALYAVASDPLVWEQHPDSNRYQLPVFQELFRESLASGGALVAVDRQTRNIIGSSRFSGYHAGKREVEIGWTFLARSHWGGKYNGAMKQLMVGHAFRFVDTVIFLVGPQNTRSQRAMEKIGGVRTGVQRNGKGGESVVYKITSSAFSERQK